MRGAGELFDRVRLPGRGVGTRLLRVVAARPREVLVLAVTLAACGWLLDSRIGIESSLPRLVPQSLGAVRDIDALQRDTGVAGEVDVLVEGRDLTDPKVIAWMRDYQNAVLLRNGYSAEDGCGKAALCPALSLPDLFRTPELSATRDQIRALLDAVPPYLSQAAITADRKTAVLAFGIRLQSLGGQRAVIEDMRSRLKPPPGVRATVAGLPVLAADANHAMSDPLRRLLTALAGLRAGRAGVVRWCTARGSGRGCRWCRSRWPRAGRRWCCGSIGVPLNPMSAALSALVIAISTEFSVLLCARFREERDGGLRGRRRAGARPTARPARPCSPRA